MARCWGGGAFGQLGGPRVDAGNTTMPSPAAPWKHVATGVRHTCALSDGGEVFCWGRAGEGQLGDGTALQWNAPQPVTAAGGGGQPDRPGRRLLPHLRL